MSSGMFGVAALFSCGAVACYLVGVNLKERVDYFTNIVRVRDLNRLDYILAKEKTTNLFVVVSGRVGSLIPFKCSTTGPLAVLSKEMAEVDLEMKLEDGDLIKESVSYLLRENETPWYLEDATGQVNIVGAQLAQGFETALQKYALDTPPTELFNKLCISQSSKVLTHCFHRRSLNIGTFLTIVGEAVRDNAEGILIQKPKEIFSGEAAFDTMLCDIMSDSEDYFRLSQILTAVAVAVTIMCFGGYIRRSFLPFRWERDDFWNRSENVESDDAETDQGKADQNMCRLTYEKFLSLVRDLYDKALGKKG